MVEEDVWITIQEIAEALYILSGQYQTFRMNDFSTTRSQLSGYFIFWRKKTRGVELHTQNLLQIYDNCDPRHQLEVVTGDETWVRYSEPERKAWYRAWVSKGKSLPQITKQNLSQKKVLYTIFFHSSGNMSQKNTRRGGEHQWEILQRACACWGQSFLTKHLLAWYQTFSR